MSHKEKLFDLLSDCQWHTFRELLDVYFKYTQRIYDLRKQGYVIDERPNEWNKHALDYKLLSHAKNPVEGAPPVVSSQKPTEKTTHGFLFNIDQHGEIV